MIKVDVNTSDSIVWNATEVYSKISYAMSTSTDLTIDLCHEGPAFDTLNLHDYMVAESICYNYDLQRVTIITQNLKENYNLCKVKKSFPIHLMDNTFEYRCVVNNKKNLKHFGFFIGRGNAPRLFLGAYLYNNYKNKIVHTNHLDLDNEFYASNIGLERLITEYNIKDIRAIAEYINQCPIGADTVNIDKSLKLNPAQQLLKNDKQTFLELYNHFAIEIVAETYFTGTTFFPTEKIWRPILLKKPFIVQGPTNYLKNLQELGFKTFSNWWDEGYGEDPACWQPMEIIKVVDKLSKLSTDSLSQIYKDMEPTLEHNRLRLLELGNEDFKKIQNG